MPKSIGSRKQASCRIVGSFLMLLGFQHTGHLSIGRVGQYDFACFIRGTDQAARGIIRVPGFLSLGIQLST
ncbi:hypothetical protein D3C76_1496630 [compost metagenome]